MAKTTKRPAAKKTAKRIHELVELEIGIFPSPFQLGDPQEEPREYEFLLAAIVGGAILIDEFDLQGNLALRAGEILRKVFNSDELPSLPGTVRTADAQLADLLRPQITTRIQFHLEPTPSLEVTRDFVFRALNKKFSYLEDTAEEEVASFFRAAARLHCTKPWMFIPQNRLFRCIISGTEEYEIVLTLTGKAETDLGFMAFANLDELEQFTEATKSRAAGEEATFPPSLGLFYKKPHEFRADLRLEIQSHGWEIASPSAWPLLMTFSAEGKQVAPLASEVAIAELLCVALAELAPHAQLVKDAFRRAEPCEMKFTVNTRDEEIQVTLGFPLLDDEDEGFDEDVDFDGFDEDEDEDEDERHRPGGFLTPG